MKHLHSRVGGLWSHGHLRAAAGASIEILPFQLEPALALIDGTASRFLLADEVGLGKTIQAGLMIAELQRRGWCERALILVPSGLRTQWADELQRRFDISPAIIDAATLSALTHSLPRDIIPWSVEPVAIASIDFIKQPEVLQGLRGLVWDILIVDEAHHAAPGSLRYEAVKMLACRSRHVVLLTATPHAGDAEAYRALCDLGKLERGDPILLFRRTRQQAGLPRSRRVHLLPVRLAPDEIQMHRLLASYVASLWRIAESTGRRDVQLAAMVLSKRAFSSAHSLATSIERRLDAISGAVPLAVQPALLFDCDGDSEDEEPQPCGGAFGRIQEEEAALRALLMAARRVNGDERKVRALRRLLRRVQEPVIVFTEYRDTLATLELEMRGLRKVTLIHGGQTAQERHDSSHRFTTGTADLLLATDAGAEGLNLHSRCRLVVNLELPWNPMRLEQRIGRVDRIGQSRTVHAINLYADCTAESTVLARLVRRLDRIHASEIEIAASVISNAPFPVRREEAPATCTETIDVRARAQAEASRASEGRVRERAPSGLTAGTLPVARIRITPLRGLEIKPMTAIYFVRVRIANLAGRLIENTVLALAVRTPVCADLCQRQRLRARDVRAMAERMLEENEQSVIALAAQLGRNRAAALDREMATTVNRAIRRESQISEITACEPALVQPGLFDNRALRRQLVDEQHHRTLVSECVRRAALVEAGATTVLTHDPHIELMLITC